MKKRILHPVEAHAAAMTRRNFFGKMAQGIGGLALGSMINPGMLMAGNANLSVGG